MNQAFEALHFLIILVGIFTICGFAAAFYLWFEQFTVPFTSYQRTMENLNRATPVQFRE